MEEEKYLYKWLQYATVWMKEYSGRKSIQLTKWETLVNHSCMKAQKK